MYSLPTMKTLIISLCFFLLFACPNPFATAQEVVDSDGDPLQPGAEYYAKSTSQVGGPSLAAYGCPKKVINDPQTDGLPITIHPKQGSNIVESTDVYIEFTEGTGSDCPVYATTIWTASRGPGGTTDISVGGGYDSSLSDLQIVRLGSAYMFTYVGSFIADHGYSLGVWNRYDDVPYLVVFLKKTSANVIKLPN